MFKNILSALTVAGIAVALAGTQTTATAQSVGGRAVGAVNNRAALQLGICGYYDQGALKTGSSWMYLYGATMCYSGMAQSLSVTQDADGTKHAVTKGWAYDYNTFKLVGIEVDNTTNPDSSEVFSAIISDYATKAVLQTTPTFKVTSGNIVLDLTFDYSQAATAAKTAAVAKTAK